MRQSRHLWLIAMVLLLITLLLAGVAASTIFVVGYEAEPNTVTIEHRSSAKLRLQTATLTSPDPNTIIIRATLKWQDL